MIDEINLLKISFCFEDLVVYVFCKFDDEIIFGIIVEFYLNYYYLLMVYKFFIYDKVNDKENEIFFYFKLFNNSVYVYGDDD